MRLRPSAHPPDLFNGPLHRARMLSAQRHPEQQEISVRDARIRFGARTCAGTIQQMVLESLQGRDKQREAAHTQRRAKGKEFVEQRPSSAYAPTIQSNSESKRVSASCAWLSFSLPSWISVPSSSASPWSLPSSWERISWPSS